MYNSNGCGGGGACHPDHSLLRVRCWQVAVRNAFGTRGYEDNGCGGRVALSRWAGGQLLVRQLLLRLHVATGGGAGVGVGRKGLWGAVGPKVVGVMCDDL